MEDPLSDDDKHILSSDGAERFFNDKVINEYTKRLNLAAGESVKVFSTFMLQSHLRSRDEAQQARLREKRRAKLAKKRKPDVAILPININGNHWICVACDVRTGSMHFFDSLMDTSTRRDYARAVITLGSSTVFIGEPEGGGGKVMMNVVAEIVSAHCLRVGEVLPTSDDVHHYTNGQRCYRKTETSKWKWKELAYTPPPQQIDGFNCGPCMLRTIECIARGKPFDSAVGDDYAPNLRKRIAQKLLENTHFERGRIELGWRQSLKEFFVEMNQPQRLVGRKRRQAKYPAEGEPKRPHSEGAVEYVPDSQEERQYAADAAADAAVVVIDCSFLDLCSLTI
ncbi:MAG: hypothetical protein CL678_15290 [Bdellovibrionaceae bacterium]|nr:hypothetical protein [Pseudobdellovibrionaceae bacterium]|tara:strand:- start:1145 stop:2161 length:1017 start_codon:yes stop_codon:yes gene_type:complete